MLEHMGLYLQYTISFLIELVQESIPSKFQSAGLLLAAVGINIPNRSIISGLQCNFTNSLCFLRARPLPPITAQFSPPHPQTRKLLLSKWNSLASLCL